MKIFLGESGRSFVVIGNSGGWWFSPRGPRFTMTADEAFDPDCSPEKALEQCHVMKNGGGSSLGDIFRFHREGAKSIFTMPTMEEVEEMLKNLRSGNISREKLHVELTGPFEVSVKETQQKEMA